MLTLSDVPRLVEAARKLVQAIEEAIDPSGPAGIRVTKPELYGIMQACGSLIVEVAKALAD